MIPTGSFVGSGLGPGICFFPGSGSPGQAVVAGFMMADRVGMMYTIPEKEGREPAYQGDKVSAESPKVAAFRWRSDDDMCRGVLGHQSSKDLAPPRTCLTCPILAEPI